VHSDSQGALAGICAYEEQSGERKRLRMAARPLLQLIHRQLELRREAGGAATLHHVKAHTQDTDVHSVGNRLSDLQANRARQRPDHPRPLALKEFPLDECELHLSMWEAAGAGPMLIDDIRRAAVAQLKSVAMTRWSALAECRGFLAGPGMLDLGAAVLKHGPPASQAAFVHVATNSIEYHWPAAPKSPLQRLHCNRCAALLTLEHLVVCRADVGVSFRFNLHCDILAVLKREACTAEWRRKHANMHLRQHLLILFPFPASASDQEQVRHRTRTLCGAFTQSQATAAAKQLGFASATDGRPTMLQIRLLCLQHIDTLFSSLKEKAARS
jgi:hypothetical protein